MPEPQTKHNGATPAERPLAAILAGATASGKTALAVELSTRLPIEIISADSRQVYRHLDIGTAKPSADERARVPHHLIDFLELEASYNAARFAADALQLCAQIHARGNIPVVVGGAGFYLKVLREGLFTAPYSQDELQRVRREVATWSTETMHRELSVRDPERLVSIHPNDRYRLSRALEICLAAGRSVSELTAERPQPRHRFVEFRLVVERSLLHARIIQRTQQMLEVGWVEEVAHLLESYTADLPGLQTLGYPQVISQIHGDLNRDELAELVARDTRRYARQQEIWFRKLRRATQLVGGDDDNAAQVEQALRVAFPR